MAAFPYPAQPNDHLGETDKRPESRTKNRKKLSQPPPKPPERIGVLALAFLTLTVAIYPLYCAASEAWLTLEGAGGLEWGTSSQPIDVVRRPRNLYLPDSGYVVRGAANRPDDLEWTTTGSDRHFLRYVAGSLEDAWLLREGAIDVTAFEQHATREWEGTVLGPSDAGYRAFGDAVSWVVDGRSVLHWRDRMSNTQVLVGRTLPTNTYAVRREAALAPDRESPLKARLTGSLKKVLKPWMYYLSSCLDHSTKPVLGTLDLVYDATGRPGRIRFTADQATPGGFECIASAVSVSTAAPGTTGQLEIYRFR